LSPEKAEAGPAGGREEDLQPDHRGTGEVVRQADGHCQ